MVPIFLSRVNRTLGVAALVLLGNCARLGESWVPGSEASLAKDQIMLVRKDPPSFGFQRLVSRAQLFPDLMWFVKQHGIPDFLAETGDQSRQYFILYYLKPRQAYACRTGHVHAAAVEFSGPYPITDGEFRTLDDFRRGKFR